MNKRRKVIFRAFILSLIVITALFIALRAIDGWQKRQFPESRESGTAEFMQSTAIVWQGERYKQKPGVEILLFSGIDREMNDLTGVRTSRYRSGGQADFLLLLAIDQNSEVIHQLLIDRDTITDVTVLSSFGQETGTRKMQICLSNSYGANRDENARYTMKAVRGLMNDIDIDGYYMIDLAAVDLLSEALGGITVTVPDDMTQVNPLWHKGAVITVSGQEAVSFVQARKNAGDGTNEARMNRQSLFMDSATAALRACIAKDPDAAVQLLTSLESSSATNLSQQWIVDILQQSVSYTVLPPDRLEGKHLINDEGYMEFHVQDGSAEAWIMNTLYTRLSGDL